MEPNTPPQPNIAPQTDQQSNPPAPPPAGQVIGPGGTTPAEAVPQTPQPQDPPIVMPEQYTFTPEQSAAEPPKRRRFNLKKPAVITTLAALLLLGGSAAAYLGYYVPNKPENILAKAVSNSLSEHSFTTKGVSELTSNGLNSKIEYQAAVNEDEHTADIKLDVTVSGVNIPLEIIIANANAYFKIGDLSSLQSVISQILGGMTTGGQDGYDKLFKSVSNNWIKIDSTLIKQAKLQCLADLPGGLSNTDMDSLSQSYKRSPFATITNHTSDTVNGTAATKYDIKIDDNKLSDFKLNGTAFFGRLNNCLKQAGSGGLNLKGVKDGDKTPMTLWVDKTTKRIIKYSTKSTSMDKKEGTGGTLTGTLSYAKVNVSAPASSKPILSLLNDIGILQTYQSIQLKAKDTERKTDINALHGQLEAYQAQNGKYPTLSQVNDPKWRAANLKGLDDAALQDPDGGVAKLAGKPSAHVYSYAVTPTGCDNGLKGDCTGYTLTATLDEGGTYSKQDLNR